MHRTNGKWNTQDKLELTLRLGPGEVKLWDSDSVSWKPNAAEIEVEVTLDPDKLDHVVRKAVQNSTLAAKAAHSALKVKVRK